MEIFTQVLELRLIVTTSRSLDLQMNNYQDWDRHLFIGDAAKILKSTFSSYIFPTFSYLILVVVFSVAKSCLILRLRLLNKQEKNLVSSFMRGFSCSG